MPTGYTADLHDGEQSFEEFVLRAARGMGALITMRDDAFDAEIPERFEPSDYHRKALDEAERMLADMKRLTPEEADELAEAEHAKVLAQWKEAKRTREERRQRYEAMLAKVKAWKPPTTEHEGFKKFMVEQLEESIKFDCGDTWARPVRQNGEEWRICKIAKAKEDIEYHTQQFVAEAERAAERTAWVQALRDSLGEHSLTDASAHE